MNDFFKRFNEFGFKKIFLSYDFVAAVIIFFTILWIAKDKVWEDILIKSILSDIASASIGVTTIILAGFAIIVSFTDEGFINLLNKINVYSNIVFIFEYTTINAVICFFISILLKYLVFDKYLFWLLIFIFIYLLLSLISLITFISSYGIKRSEFVKLKNSKPK